MRILLAQKLPYLPALNGASKVGRCLLEELVSRHHTCRVIALTGMADAAHQRAQVHRVLSRQALNVTSHASERPVFQYQGVEVQTFPHGHQASAHLAEAISSFQPTWTLISEDPTYLLLAAALAIDPQRTIFLSQSQATLPFGPEAFAPDPLKSQMLRQVAGIMTTSQYLKGYIERWGGLESFVAEVPVYGKPPFPYLASPDNRYVTMFNPSAIKGVSIFLELAQRFPDVAFAAVPAWATTNEDRRALARLSNVQLLEPNEDVDVIFAQTRVLIVPSLWGEAFGLVVVEAMLRGIPVLASDVGGLPEAKLGIDYVLPVRRIDHYHNRRDDKLLPTPVLPEQDSTPWLDALGTLLSDRLYYDQLAAASREAALRYVARLSITPVEQYLERLAATYPSHQKDLSQPQDNIPQAIANLSPEKLELLARLVRKRHQPRRS